jgi:hypothetical protein
MRKRGRIAPMQNVQASKRRKKRLPPLVKWLRAAGVTAELFGWGGLLLEDWFWAGVVAINLGFVVLALDFLFEPDFRDRWKDRCVVWGLLFILAAVFNWGFVFVEGPLPVAAFETNGTYPAGTVIAGINWRPQFTELNVDIANQTDRAYEELNLVIRPTSAVAALAQVSNISDVSFEDKNGASTRLLEVDSRTGSSKAIPLVLIATDAGYRVRCGRLPAQSHLKIVMALADIIWNPPPPVPGRPIEEGLLDPNYMLRIKTDDFGTYWLGYRGADVYATRPTSSEFLWVEGSYKVGHRKRSISQKVEVGGMTVRQQNQPVP